MLDQWWVAICTENQTENPDIQKEQTLEYSQGHKPMHDLVFQKETRKMYEVNQAKKIWKVGKSSTNLIGLQYMLMSSIKC